MHRPPNSQIGTGRTSLPGSEPTGVGNQPLPTAHRIGLHDHDAPSGDGIADENVLAKFRERAQTLHQKIVHDHGVFVIEFLGATGSGKTRILERIIEDAPSEETIGVIVGDVAGDDDAQRFRTLGVDVVNVNTGKECHLDPGLVEEAIEDLDLEALDTLYIENVGNMVCPADFPLGAQARVLVVSTTEGDDVVRKHSLLFQAGDVAVINKIDIADAVDADVETMRADIQRVNPEMPIFETNAGDDVGIDDLKSRLDDARSHGHHASDEAPGG